MSISTEVSHHGGTPSYILPTLVYRMCHHKPSIYPLYGNPFLEVLYRPFSDISMCVCQVLEGGRTSLGPCAADSSSCQVFGYETVRSDIWLLICSHVFFSCWQSLLTSLYSNNSPMLEFSCSLEWILVLELPSKNQKGCGDVNNNRHSLVFPLVETILETQVLESFNDASIPSGKQI